MNSIKHKGMTLIEVMIVVVIVSILAAIAYPSYQNSVQKSRRSTAKIALNQAAALQEKWYFQYSQYSADITTVGTSSTPEGFYTISVTAPTAGCAIATCFHMVATAIGAQADDTDCATFTISSTGAKDAFTSGNVSNKDICW
jgi:type IV pilus assembly protein PilE